MAPLLVAVVRVRHDVDFVRSRLELVRFRLDLELFPPSILVIRLLVISRDRTEFKYESTACSSIIPNFRARMREVLETADDRSRINSQHSS